MQSPGTVFYALASGLSKVTSEGVPFRMVVQPYSGTSTFLPLLDSGEVAFGINNAGVGFGWGLTDTRLDDLSLVQVAYDEMSQRLIRRVPHPDREGIQTIIDQLAKTRPQMKNLNPGDFIDPSILKEIEDSGFVKKL
jgi:uncharacterized protein